MLTNKVALVTGGGTGIGRGIAIELARAGATIVICGRTERTLAEVIDHLPSVGGSGSYITADVTDEASVKAMVAAIIAEHGQLDILVNNAGVEGDYCGPMENMPTDAFDQLMDVNLKSQFLMCKAVIPHMKERAAMLTAEGEDFATRAQRRPHAGAIINLSSVAGKRGAANMAMYCTSNFARIGLTQSLALELAPFCITVNAICPGMLWSPMWDRLACSFGGDNSETAKQELFKNTIEALIPMKRPQLASEIGELAVYLSSQPNITGQSPAVDGGYCA